MARPMVQVNVRIPPELHAQLTTEATATTTTVTAIVTKALETYLHEKGKGK